MKIDKKYIYIDDDTGKELFDFCEICQRPIVQEDVGDGVYGCEYCKNPNQITIHKVKDVKE